MKTIALLLLLASSTAFAGNTDDEGDFRDANLDVVPSSKLGAKCYVKAVDTYLLCRARNDRKDCAKLTAKVRDACQVAEGLPQ